MTEPLPRAFGHDRVETGPGEEVLLLCRPPKSWAARQPRTLTTAEYPGTAVEWEGRLFEVLHAIPTPEGGMRYRLAAWEEGHAIRRMERYDEVSETIREGERRDRNRDLLLRRLAIGLAPLAGLLPGETQKKMERDFGAPSLGMTVASASPLFLVGFLGLFAALVGNAGGALDLPSWIAPPLAISAYLFAESALRLASAIAGQEPMGSLPVVLVFAAWNLVRHPTATKPAAGVPEAEFSPQDALDRFHMLGPALSLLSAGEQRDLIVRFQFEALRSGKITAALILAASALNTFVSLAAFEGRDGLLPEILWLAPAGYLAVEQILRLEALSRGQPAGSVLGRLVRPFAKPLFVTPCALGLPGRG